MREVRIVSELQQRERMRQRRQQIRQRRQQRLANLSHQQPDEFSVGRSVGNRRATCPSSSVSDTLNETEHPSAQADQFLRQDLCESERSEAGLDLVNSNEEAKTPDRNK